MPLCPSLREFLASLKILVIGDVMLDHYIWGDATRISPEAPVPVVSVARDSYVPGGAANVAANLAGLGVGVTLLGSYGGDEGGSRLGELLQSRGIRLIPEGRGTGVRTIVKTRVMAQRQQMCRIDREDPPGNYNLFERVGLQGIRDLVAGVAAILVSDYAKGVVTQPLLETLRQFGGPAGRPLLAVDPKPRRHLDLRSVDLMTPNRSEALQLADLPADPHAGFDDTEVCRRIHAKFQPRNLVVTLGAEGMLLCRDGAILGRLPTVAREVFDVSGAGDTVVATLTAALAAGQSLEAAAALANRAAGIVVSHLGTSPIAASDLFSEAENGT